MTSPTAAIRCPACAHETHAQARFCDRCGSRLEPARAPAAAGASAGARRQVTIMFCDLVGSTALSQRMDPEELRDIVRDYHDLCAREIARVGGTVAQYLGDGVLAFFGYPTAREQDAQAAIRAGLAIVAAMRERGDDDAGLAVRVGIHSGLVVAEELSTGSREPTVVGSTPNVAARVQGVARPNSVVISETTYRLVEGFFACRDLGPQEMKGVAAPVRVYEILGQSGAQNRLDATLGSALTPLVARHREVGTLLDAWERARAGRGQVVLVRGDAGLGKSRLLHELKQRLADQTHARLECRCAPHFENSALYPVIDLVERLFGIGRGDSDAERTARLKRAATYAADAPDAVPLLAALLSLPAPPGHPPLTLSPQRQKVRTLEVLVGILAGLAAEQPVLFAVEDLHWIDPSSRELLNLVVERAPMHRVLVVLLFRQSFDAGAWEHRPGIATLELGRLTPEDARGMIAHCAGGRSLPPEIEAELCEKADGVPLYLEELTRMTLESGCLRERDGRYELARERTALAIPVTLQESLMARLDRLAPVREVVQLGATIGRTFTYDLMHAVANLDDAVLRAELAQLVDNDILFLRTTASEVTYVFKHALIQEAAYESLLRDRRRHYHERIARAFEGTFPEVVATRPELLAYHWAGAGMSAPAASYFRRAAERANERSAYVEAVSQARSGLALTDAMPAGTERARLELELRIVLGAALVATNGFAAPEVAEVYARAHVLCEEVGEPRLLYSALSGLLLFHQSRAELATCLQLCDQRLALAERLGDRALAMQVFENRGTLSFWRGEFEAALASVRQALALYEPESARALTLVYGTDVAVVSTTYTAQALWMLGSPDQAAHEMARAVARARALGHANSLGLALAFAATLHHSRGEVTQTRALAEEVIAFSTEQQLPFWLAYGTIYRGLALGADGRAADGIPIMMEGMAAFAGTGAQIGARFCVAMLAQLYLQAGMADEGLGFLDGMLPALDASEDRVYDGEAQRVRGELLLASAPDVRAAEQSFQDALADARRCRARALEVRAATSLARLWHSTGKDDEARNLLRPVYAAFSEGFDTADLRLAAAVLAELGVDAGAGPAAVARA